MTSGMSRTDSIARSADHHPLPDANVNIVMEDWFEFRPRSAPDPVKLNATAWLVIAYLDQRDGDQPASPRDLGSGCRSRRTPNIPILTRQFRPVELITWLAYPRTGNAALIPAIAEIRRGGGCRSRGRVMRPRPGRSRAAPGPLRFRLALRAETRWSARRPRSCSQLGAAARARARVRRAVGQADTVGHRVRIGLVPDRQGRQTMVQAWRASALICRSISHSVGPRLWGGCRPGTAPRRHRRCRSRPEPNWSVSTALGPLPEWGCAQPLRQDLRRQPRLEGVAAQPVGAGRTRPDFLPSRRSGPNFARRVVGHRAAVPEAEQEGRCPPAHRPGSSSARIRPVKPKCSTSQPASPTVANR